jgi:hypothetical protein
MNHGDFIICLLGVSLRSRFPVVMLDAHVFQCMYASNAYQ